MSFEKPVYEDFIDPSTAATNLEQMAVASPFFDTDSKMTYGTDQVLESRNQGDDHFFFRK